MIVTVPARSHQLQIITPKSKYELAGSQGLAISEIEKDTSRRSEIFKDIDRL
jgi:hypothetical protein